MNGRWCDTYNCLKKHSDFGARYLFQNSTKYSRHSVWYRFVKKSKRTLEEEKGRKKELEYSAFFVAMENLRKNCTLFGHHFKQCGQFTVSFRDVLQKLLSCMYVLLRWVEVEIAEQLSHVFLVKKGLSPCFIARSSFNQRQFSRSFKV